MGVHLFAVEGIPVAGMDRSIGVLDDDAMDGKIEVDCLSNGKITAESGPGDFLNLGEGKAV